MAFDSTYTNETLTCGRTFYMQFRVDEHLRMQLRGDSEAKKEVYIVCLIR